MSGTHYSPPTTPEWTVRQVIHRSDWKDTTRICPTCGESVDQMCGHCQVELDRKRTPPPGSKLTRERRLLAFCNEECATIWLDAD
ncbi:hypothetical protein [Haloquadratum walsbyi]|uniref:Uncharacterized protein n=1 Tax=Haloquadratum walsbyi J07HQW2 TaxID=1238425 RepID=U1MWG2_9EURY|nr:hypothetical protein [Haloquadratum walsbyi]ERG94774.1 MAG: hypothetical protein J07HQW2_01216 [Haloquadratum walsbyi J07HQW2]